MRFKLTAENIFPLLYSKFYAHANFASLQILTDALDPLIIPKIQAFSGEGIHIKTNIDIAKGEILDFCGQTVTCILGQNDPWVTANMTAYLLSNKPSFLSTTMGQDIFYTLPQRVRELTKMGADSFVNHRLNNGSDANDFAVNLAYFYHKNDKERKILLAFKGSYHGQGHLLYAISELETYRSFFGGVQIKFLDTPSHAESIKKGQLSLNDQKIIEQIKKLSKKAFAIIIEPLQFNNNGNVCSQAFIEALREICTSCDLPLLFDEVQSCWGWLGTMTAAERYGVWPDIMVISKSLTAGYGPLSMVIAKNKFKKLGAYGARTNGADVRSLVAAHAVTDRLVGTQDIPKQIINTQLGKELQRGLLVDFSYKHQFLLEQLNKLREEVNSTAQSLQIGLIKGSGLARLIEIKDRYGKFSSSLTTKLQHELLAKARVFVRIPSNEDAHTLYIKMPIVATTSEMEEGFSRIKKVMINYI